MGFGKQGITVRSIVIPFVKSLNGVVYQGGVLAVMIIRITNILVVQRM